MHRISDYSYDLPEELIAQEPSPMRSRSRLLVLDRVSGALLHRIFDEIGSFLRPGDVLVINDTKVIPARFEAFRSSGGHVEVFLLDGQDENRFRALVRPSSRLKEGERLGLHAGGEARLEAFMGGGLWKVRFEKLPPHTSLEQFGRMPLPHYIRREKLSDPQDAMDRERYQTVYSTHPGAVAAPTAGLHFTEDLLEHLERQGIRIARLTLHVGIGTFAPVRHEDFRGHEMHAERFHLPEESADRINEARRKGGRIVAVGTTSARVLETCARTDGFVEPGRGETSLFVYPPYRFKALDLLLTNFHLPKSTLLLLVSALAGRKRLLEAYKEAIRMKYRFFSYGDSMLIGDGLIEDQEI